MVTIDCAIDSATRARTLYAAWLEAPESAEVTVKVGTYEDGAPAVILFVEDEPHPFTAEEARIAADIAEVCMHRYPTVEEEHTTLNLIHALRTGAERAERIKARKERGPLLWNAAAALCGVTIVCDLGGNGPIWHLLRGIGVVG